MELKYAISLHSAGFSAVTEFKTKPLNYLIDTIGCESLFLWIKLTKNVVLIIKPTKYQSIEVAAFDCLNQIL